MGLLCKEACLYDKSVARGHWPQVVSREAAKIIQTKTIGTAATSMPVSDHRYCSMPVPDHRHCCHQHACVRPSVLFHARTRPSAQLPPACPYQTIGTAATSMPVSDHRHCCHQHARIRPSALPPPACLFQGQRGLTNHKVQTDKQTNHQVQTDKQTNHQVQTGKQIKEKCFRRVNKNANIYSTFEVKIRANHAATTN